MDCLAVGANDATFTDFFYFSKFLISPNIKGDMETGRC